MPVSGDGKRTVSASRWTEHRAEDGGWNRAHQESGDQAWTIHQFGSQREAVGSGTFENDTGHLLATAADLKGFGDSRFNPCGEAEKNTAPHKKGEGASLGRRA